MNKALLVATYFCISATCVVATSQDAPPVMAPAQQAVSPANPNSQKMTNADVIELAGLGLSDDVIIDKIYASKACDFDTSVAGLKALKAVKISDAVIRVMINPSRPVPQSSANPGERTGGEQTPTVSTSDGSATQQAAASLQSTNKPRVFFQSASHGNTQNASRDQSMEMSKDFEQDCPAVQITINQQMADYTVALNHIEVGLARDNQVQVADKNGDLMSKTKEGGSIRAGMKKACGIVLADWAKRAK
jgi:hypothetical protein